MTMDKNTIKGPKQPLLSPVENDEDAASFQALCGAFRTFVLLTRAEGVKNPTSRTELAAMVEEAFVSKKDITKLETSPDDMMLSLIERVEKETGNELLRKSQVRVDGSVSNSWFLRFGSFLVSTGFAQRSPEDDFFDKLPGIKLLPGQMDRLCHFDHVKLSFHLSPGWKARMRTTVVSENFSPNTTSEAIFTVTITIVTTASGQSFHPHIYCHTTGTEPTEDKFESEVEHVHLDAMSVYFPDLADIPGRRVLQVLTPKSAELCDTLRAHGIYAIPKMANSISTQMELILRRFKALLKVNSDTLIHHREGKIAQNDIDLLVFGGKVIDSDDSPVLVNAYTESFQKDQVIKAWKKLGDFTIENVNEVAKETMGELETQNAAFTKALDSYGYNGTVFKKQFSPNALDDIFESMTNPKAKFEDMKASKETSLVFEDRESKAREVLEERRDKDLRVKDLDCLIRWKLGSSIPGLKTKEEKMAKWKEIAHLPAPEYKRWTECDESQFLDQLDQVIMSLKKTEI